MKSCKTAYHVTCAFRHNLEMKAIVEDEHSEDGVKLKVGHNIASQYKSNNSFLFVVFLVVLLEAFRCEKTGQHRGRSKRW